MNAARSNMLGAGMPNNKVKYSRLAADDDGYLDLQVRRLSPFRNSTNRDEGISPIMCHVKSISTDGFLDKLFVCFKRTILIVLGFFSQKNKTVQEEPTEGAIQGNRPGSVSVPDWLVADRLRRSPSVRNYPG